MSAKKYDWPSLKEEFIASRYLDALSWARNTTSPLPVLHGANFKLHTKGWRDDKQSFLEKRSELIIQKMLDSEAERNATALISLLRLIHAKVAEPASLSIKDIRTLWAILRVENGMPTTITKNEYRDLQGKKESEKSEQAALAKLCLKINS